MDHVTLTTPICCLFGILTGTL